MIVIGKIVDLTAGTVPGRPLAEAQIMTDGLGLFLGKMQGTRIIRAAVTMTADLLTIMIVVGMKTDAATRGNTMTGPQGTQRTVTEVGLVE